MRKMGILLAVMALQGAVQLAQAQTLKVSSLRYWTQPKEARLVLDTTEMPIGNVMVMQNPLRLVIEFKKAELVGSLKQPSGANRFFETFYSDYTENNNLKVTIALKKPVTFKTFTLEPNRVYGHRLVIDVFEASPATVMASHTTTASALMKTAELEAVTPSRQESKRLPAKPVVYEADDNHATATPIHKNEKPTPVNRRHANKQLVIAIDAGHGGKDPGSHGSAGTEEKEVVFQIAKKLEQLIAQQPGMTPVMVRNGDYFIKLRERMQVAREAKADLFVSIHADAFKNADAKGASVFTLSNRGATSEAARWLASHENSADLVGGISLDDKDEMLASVLLDLSQTATTEASSHLAKKVLANFRGINPLHKASVQKAGFMVLKSPDIPSILVETAFISNPEEEMKLRSDAHQAKVAKAIFNGIVSYFKQYAPLNAPATRIAEASATDKG